MEKGFTYDKATLRERMASVRRALADKPILSAAACRTAEKIVGGKVLIYVPIGSELDTLPLIGSLSARTDVAVYVPYTAGGVISPRRLVRLGKPDGIGNLPENCYGAATDADKLDFCITPLLGFNDAGYRLGYGKGCYDKLFSSARCIRTGIAFEAQRINFSPEPHDMPLDCCVTEQKVIYF